MNLLSAFGGGLWVIPVLTIAGAVVCAVKGYQSSKSGSEKYVENVGWVVSNKNVPFYKTGYGVFSILLTLATIAIIILMISEK